MSEGGQHETVLQNAFGYTPNKPAAIIAGTIFGILSFTLFTRLLLRRDWWGLCLPIGTLTYCAGFFLRIAVVNSPDSLGLFIIMQLFTVTSPAAFLAFNYIIYGRLIRHRVGDRYSMIRPQIVAKVFVISDVTTFLVQGGGGGLESSESSAKLGSRILLIGLIAQTVSYLVFIVLLLDSHRRIRKDLVYVDSYPFMRIIHMLYISSAFIMIRGAYRVVEFAQGNKGFLVTHEVYFYFLDALPLLFAAAIYAPVWPGRYISQVPREEMLGFQKLSNHPNSMPLRDLERASRP